MVKLTPEIKETMAGFKCLYMATCSKDGTPNVAPMGAMKIVDDETILISDQFMNKTLKNLKENPKVSIAFWGEKGGYQVKGDVEIHVGDKVFEDDVAWIKSTKPQLNPKSAIIIKVKEAYMIKPGPDAGKKVL